MRVVAPDLPGRGRSAPVAHAEDYGTALYLAVLGALIAHLGVNEIDWIGTSLGGHIGMELAARPGTPIRRLVLNDFGARVPVAALQRISNYLRNTRRFRTLAEVETYLREIYAPLTDKTFQPGTGALQHLAQSLTSATIAASPDPPSSATYANPVSVTVSVPFNSVSWLPSPMYLGGKTMTYTATMRRETIP
jgi:pimeloyl-ACP methyl ester carboxylesterase